MKTQEEINEFLQMNNITLEETSSSQSFKTNLLIIKRNFIKLVSYLNVTLSFIKNLYETIDINQIIQSVLNLLESAKTVLEIDVTLNVGTSTTQQIGTRIFRIERLNDFQVKITGDNITNWNTDNIIVFVKTFDGTVAYPTIVTANSQINIYFNDIIGTNYKVILL